MVSDPGSSKRVSEECKKAFESAKLGNLSLVIGSSLVFLIFSILLITSISLALGYSILRIEIYLAVFATVLFIAWATRQYFEAPVLKVFAVVTIFLAISAWIFLVVSGKLYDVSYDGQVYHQEAIIQLTDGWNPFYKTLLPQDHSHYLSINCYPKGPWICAAALYKITGRIEQSKSFNLVFMMISFFISLSALLSMDKVRLGTAVILGSLLSMNPVSICQSLSFYVDGQLSSMLITLASLLYLLFKRWDRLTLLTTALTIPIVINIKFTGIAYLLIFICEGLLCAWLYGKRTLVLSMVLVVALSFPVGLLLIGYSPYITNTLQHGHPFYPLGGAKSVDIIQFNMPGKFSEMNRFEKLFVSLYSESRNAVQPDTYEWKIPFTVNEAELRTFFSPDTRIGGWGPLFGSVLLISFLIISLGLKLDLPRTIIAAGVGFLVMVTVFVNPESWWARYSPQLWIAPFIFVLLSEHLQGKLIHVLAGITIFVLILNVLLVSGSYLRGQYHINQALKRQLMSIKNQQEPAIVYFGDFRSNRIRLRELGIKYSETKELKCSEYLSLVSSKTKLCLKQP